MTASGSSIYGEVLNKESVFDTMTGDVKASTTLEIGWVYQDGANGWAQATGSEDGRQLYWNDRKIDNSSGSKGDKIGTFWGSGACVISRADGAITRFNWVKATDTANHLGQTEAAAITTTSVTTLHNSYKAIVGRYIGKPGEQVESGNDVSDAADENLIVVEVKRAL